MQHDHREPNSEVYYQLLTRNQQRYASSYQIDPIGNYQTSEPLVRNGPVGHRDPLPEPTRDCGGALLHAHPSLQHDPGGAHP